MDIDEQEHAQEPRRGGRARKVVERFQPGGDAGGYPVVRARTLEADRIIAGNRTGRKSLNAAGSDEVSFVVSTCAGQDRCIAGRRS